MRIAFDANALGYLCEEKPLHREARLRLRHRVKHETAHVLAGWPNVAELSILAEHHRGRFNLQLRELERLTRGRLLRQWLNRAPLETKRRRRLPLREAWQPMAESRSYFRSMLSDPAFSKNEARVALRLKESYARAETDSKTDYRAEASRLDLTNGGNVAKEWTARFSSSPDEVVDDWVTTRALRDYRDTWGLGSDESTWPAPKDVPSLRADVAYHLGRVYLVGLEAMGKGKIDGNDYFDNLHFLDAVYADVLVTSDKGFHRIVGVAGKTGVRLQRFDEWAKEFVSTPA